MHVDHTKSRTGPHILVVRVHKIPDAYQEFEDVFSGTLSQEIPKHSPWNHVINTQDAKVIYGPIYPLSKKQLQVLSEYLKENLECGWICPSKFLAGAPVLFVPKKEGSLRFCANYRALNAITVKNRYPLPLVTKLLDQV